MVTVAILRETFLLIYLIADSRPSPSMSQSESETRDTMAENLKHDGQRETTIGVKPEIK